jgi:nicotinate-nucleotide--dimethylbenzimidazole phosphoribosyltransferase
VASAQDYNQLGSGEMGIGNTTTSSAMLAAILNVDAAEVTGRGAGLSDEKLINKQKIIRQAIAINKPNQDDPIDVLHKLGGLDLAALTGYYMSCSQRTAVVIDGFITAVAALTAID